MISGTDCGQCGEMLRDYTHRTVEGLYPQNTNSRLITHQSLFAVPFDHNVRAPNRLPRHTHLDLSQHVVQKVSRFKLREHILKVVGIMK